MKRSTILHVCTLDKFIPPFIDFIEEHFDNFYERHRFFILGDPEKYPYKNRVNIHQVKRNKLNKFTSLLRLVWSLNKADKIILHALFNPYIVILLALMPWTLGKCYWVIWGGDLYSYKLAERTTKWRINEFFRRIVIGRIGYITTTVPGDYEKAKHWYGVNSIYIQNIIYPSHIARCFDSYLCNVNKEGRTFVQIGNSADLSNNHEDIIERLSKLKYDKITYFCPLSYGDEFYAKKVIKYGKEMLGKFFYPITKFMSFDEYNQYMSCIDVAIFNHDRQQAMGNIIGLVSLGKKVYVKSTTTTYNYLLNLGINVYATDKDIVLESIPFEIAKKNIVVANNFFTIEKLKDDWCKVFYGG